MAQLKDTVVQGSLRVTDTLYTTIVQLSILNAPTSSNGTAYGPGTADYVLMSNGTSVYWGTGVTNALKALDVTTIGNTNGTKYIAAISQADGKISATAIDVATTYSSTGTTAISGTGVAAAIGTLDVSSVGGDTSYISAISESDGKISATSKSIQSTYSSTGTLAINGTGVAAALATLDSTLPSGSAASKTLTALTITDGKMASATFSNIAICAGQVTSGTLSVERGGTGIATASYKNAIIAGNASTVTSAFQAIRTNNGAFYATAQDGAPSFGILPAAQGGTGNNSGTATYATTTQETSAALYPIGVTSSATTTLKRDTSITMIGGAISAASLSLTGTLGVSGAATLSSTLSVSGATTLSSTLNLNGIFKSNSSNYGAALPETGNSEGRIFFQTAAIEYELPAGGIEGSFLIKATDDDRDVIWGDTVKRLTSLEGIAIVSGGLLITNGGVVARNSTIEAYRVYNAVWNDYAECRQSKEVEPGRVITETYGGIMELASQRLMPACKVISDTYGALMGESNLAKTPIAVAGRVLVYPYKNQESYNLGDAVCSAPGGTVDIMSREEIRDYPERIIGTVSEIPTYDTWYAGDKDNPTSVSVNGRIWIYVR